MVTGLARNGAIEDACKYFDQMPAKDIAAYNAMVTAYAGNGFIIDAVELFNVMPDRNMVTWNVIIDGYVKEGLHGEAFRHFAHMLRLSVRPNSTTFATILASFEAVIEITQVHSLIILLGFDPYTLTSNALITAYSRSGDIGSAQLTFGRLVAKDVVSWTAMISAYAIHGCVANALTVFANMIRSGAIPDRITFLGVLWACSHSGLVEKGQRVFNSMTQGYHLEPANEHYACLVDLLARAGFVREAKRVLRRIPPDQCDAPILAALLRVNYVEGHSEETVKLVGQKLIELEPDVCGGYVQLANLNASQGKWPEVAEVRKKMRGRNVKKLAGYSEIVVQKTKHIFYSGDRRHPQAKEIYAMLDQELLPSMKDINASG
ncbi:pentatricopeptide repeat-containing protein At4g02750-like [Aristolochia californica]|uniref:pentatricopeptide repeat-containing protein At4g02750-like n=1 Tax=Aristolochia californica TaxID=171875 RepID=UPI0035DA5C3B